MSAIQQQDSSSVILLFYMKNHWQYPTFHVH